MPSKDFFDEPEEQSIVKAQIVADYFDAWSRIMAKRAPKIGYFDFFAGPGRYKTGEKSVPLLILERAIASPKIRERLVTIFNDANPSHSKALEDEVAELPGIESLRYAPLIATNQVDEAVADYFEAHRLIPAISFIDPWGYKGMSLRLIKSVIKDWGSEVVFFFNYNRINMGINNPKVKAHMEALLGPERLARLVEASKGLSPSEREALMRRSLGEALEDLGAPFLIPFRFMRADARTSHYICFVSKDQLGYEIMKEIMATKGLVDEDGVPLFEYIPSSGGKQAAFDRPRPYLALPGALVDEFAGKTVTMNDVYKRHNVGTPFIKKNYKRVLIEMESKGEITCDRPAEKRPPNTLGDSVEITFP